MVIKQMHCGSTRTPERNPMSVIEMIEFTTHPSTTTESLETTLLALDEELASLGGLESRELFRVDGAENAWLLDYRWASLETAQRSMGAVSESAVFGSLMALVASPETMKLTYGVPATA